MEGAKDSGTTFYIFRWSAAGLSSTRLLVPRAELYPQYTELSSCSVTILLLGPLSLNSRNFSSLLIPLQILPNIKEITVVH